MTKAKPGTLDWWIRSRWRKGEGLSLYKEGALHAASGELWIRLDIIQISQRANALNWRWECRVNERSVRSMEVWELTSAKAEAIQYLGQLSRIR